MAELIHEPRKRGQEKEHYLFPEPSCLSELLSLGPSISHSGHTLLSGEGQQYNLWEDY